MTTKSEPDLAAMARALTKEADDSGDRWGYLPGNPRYEDYLRALSKTNDMDAFLDFILKPDDFERPYLLFPTLKRLAEITEPDAHLYALINDLSIWAAEDLDEKYAWGERARKLAPDDPLVLWRVFLNSGGEYTREEQDELLDRIARVAPEDRHLVDLWRSYHSALDANDMETANRASSEFARSYGERPIPRDALLARLRPRKQGP